MATTTKNWFVLRVASNREDQVRDALERKVKIENVGDLIGPGYASNYGKRNQAKFVYLTATLDAAIWGAELAVGEGRGRIYIVEPTGFIEDDPNLTDKRFPGNPTKSYRSREPLRVVGELEDWIGHPPEQLQRMRDHLEELKRQGIEAIEE